MTTEPSKRPLQARVATVLAELLRMDLPEVSWRLWPVSTSPAAHLYAAPRDSLCCPLEGQADTQNDLRAWADRLGTPLLPRGGVSLGTVTVIDEVKVLIWCRAG
ncbi:hypothetical protein [Nocardiopsis dassonvillei]|uniref:hypothetical protein n=1 Tax=Nocardiopsis dassonvillei TaxID=2014 RepID=UPI00366A6A57